MVSEREVLEKKLINEFDAKIWAEKFIEVVKINPVIATDIGTMTGWFANAIMVGYDKAKNDLASKQGERRGSW